MVRAVPLSAGPFSFVEPWIAGDGDHLGWNMADAWTDPDSMLSWHRDLIALRRSSPALLYGTCEFTDTRPGRWVHRRVLDGEEVVVVVNLTDAAQAARDLAGAYEVVMESAGLGSGRLGPYGVRILRRVAF